MRMDIDKPRTHHLAGCIDDLVRIFRRIAQRDNLAVLDADIAGITLGTR